MELIIHHFIGTYNTSLVSFINASVINQCNAYNTSHVTFTNTSITTLNASVVSSFTNLQNLSCINSSFLYVNISNLSCISASFNIINISTLKCTDLYNTINTSIINSNNNYVVLMRNLHVALHKPSLKI